MNYSLIYYTNTSYYIFIHNTFNKCVYMQKHKIKNLKKENLYGK